MAKIDLLRQRTREVHLRNDIQKMGQLQLGSNFNFSVKYAPNNQSCVATIYQSFEDKSDDHLFSASVTLEGIFNCHDVNTDEDKKAAHLAAYEALFPYLQSVVGQLFASTGIPGFMVKKMTLDQNRVVVAQKKPDAPTLPIV